MKLRMWADLAMTVLLLCQMAWLLIGETTHEWTGTAMFLLFIVHHVLNRRWYGSLFKGKHGPARLLQITVDILLLAAMAGLIISGVMLSRTEFAFSRQASRWCCFRSVHRHAGHVDMRRALYDEIIEEEMTCRRAFAFPYRKR